MIRQILIDSDTLLDENARIEPLSGGNTNKLYKIDLPSQEKSILCRINGIGTENLLDRKQEIEYMELLSHYNQGPHVLCTFENGFFYDFIPGRCLQPHELAQHAPFIARQLAEFHKVQINAADKSPVVFKMLKKWFNGCKGFNWSNEAKQKQAQLLDIDRMEQELLCIENLANNCGLDIVFCHNDLLAYNILVDENTNSYHFIDYEYCGYNYRAFDIGNHFCEYTGFTVDPSKYPSEEQRKMFIRAYLEVAKGTESVSDQSIDELSLQTNLFSLVAHIFWGTWGIWQAYYSNIDFDYLTYAGEKYAWFWQTRDKYVQEFVEYYKNKA
jgi:ethanolamine kinase